MRNQMERSTFEAWLAIALSGIGAVVTSWWAKGLLLVVAAGLLIDIAFRSRWTAVWPIWGKITAMLAVVGLVIFLGGEPIATEFRKWKETDNYKTTPASPNFVESSAIPPEIVRQFEKSRTPRLGHPTRPIEVTTGVYQASHERAMVVSLLAVLDVFVLPKDRMLKAIRQHHAKIDDARKWWSDAYLRSRFKPPKGKNPPEYRVAELWSENPEKWKWIGWREWSCPFSGEKFYYQISENGIILGVLPTSETLGSSQIFVINNDGEWSSSISESVCAPACNEKTATVNGVVLHGRFVKPPPPP